MIETHKIWKMGKYSLNNFALCLNFTNLIGQSWIPWLPGTLLYYSPYDVTFYALSAGNNLNRNILVNLWNHGSKPQAQLSRRLMCIKRCKFHACPSMCARGAGREKSQYMYDHSLYKSISRFTNWWRMMFSLYLAVEGGTRTSCFTDVCFFTWCCEMI